MELINKSINYSASSPSPDCYKIPDNFSKNAQKGKIYSFGKQLEYAKKVILKSLAYHIFHLGKGIIQAPVVILLEQSLEKRLQNIL